MGIWLAGTLLFVIQEEPMAAMECTGIFELAVQGGCGVLREMQRLLSEAKTQEERDSLVNAVSSYQDFKQVSTV